MATYLPRPRALSIPVWELEEVRERKGMLYLTGWLFDRDAEVEWLELELQGRRGNQVGAIPVQPCLPRPDVELSHPGRPNSRYSGFVAVGAWPRPSKKDDRLLIRGVLKDGRRLELEIPSWRWREEGAFTSRLKRLLAGARQLLGYLLKGATLLRSGQFRSLSQKLRRQLAERPQAALPAVPEWRELLRAEDRDAPAPIRLVIDHRLGGGANLYRERLVSAWLAEGNVVLTLSFHLPSLSKILIVETERSRRSFALEDDLHLLHALADLPLETITYNTAVSFPEPQTIPALILALRQRSGATLTLLLHDYFMICPSHFLLDHGGAFCDLPDPAVCRRCLPRNPHGFTTLFQGDITSWRKAWGPLIAAADRIVAFSESSAELLQRCYEPWLAPEVIEVRPHRVDYLPIHSLPPPPASPLTIGIVGQIGYHKGAEVVRQLAETIRLRGSSERIVVIGSLETAADPRIVQQTGPYRHAELPDLIARSGANIMLVPAIWPETFSYVAEELMLLGLPLACFDLGAPAERIRKYPKGMVLRSRDPEFILECLHVHLRRQHTPVEPSPS